MNRTKPERLTDKEIAFYCSSLITMISFVGSSTPACIAIFVVYMLLISVICYSSKLPELRDYV